jgi:hypothetical protein
VSEAKVAEIFGVSEQTASTYRSKKKFHLSSLKVVFFVKYVRYATKAILGIVI